MYGLVNEALRELVIAEHGAEVWRHIANRAGVSPNPFISMQAYDDATSYALVGAAADVLRTEPSTLLERFGEHWIRFSAERGYGKLLDLCGRDLGEFLEQMDALHARVKLALPDLNPPVLSVTRLGPRSLRLVYRTKRPGLAPLVVGIVRGLGVRFRVQVAIEHVVTRREERPDEFLVRWEEAA